MPSPLTPLLHSPNSVHSGEKGLFDAFGADLFVPCAAAGA
jgi:hypothetical protein